MLKLLEQGKVALSWFVYYEWLILFGKSKAKRSGQRKPIQEDEEGLGVGDLNALKGEEKAY